MSDNIIVMGAILPKCGGVYEGFNKKTNTRYKE